MAVDRMPRVPTAQDLSWFLDLRRNNQIDLNPPYQRRSVWTRKDRQFFLDTVFRGFPSPAVFLHKSVSEDGVAKYHVVDGKQRLETIFDFTEDRLKIADDFGDTRLEGKKWSQLDTETKRLLWNYQVPVEMVDFRDPEIVNQVFARLNRNARKLKEQELRHARFDGWFIRAAEEEVSRPEWRQLGLVTNAREKRMTATQTLSELLFIILEGDIMGFDQVRLDELYAKYDEYDQEDDSGNPPPRLTVDQALEQIQATRQFLLDMEAANQVVSRFARTVGNLYTLWGVIALHRQDLGTPDEAARKYHAFMQLVDVVAESSRPDSAPGLAVGAEYERPKAYWLQSRGASTDLTARRTRHDILLAVLRSEG